MVHMDADIILPLLGAVGCILIICIMNYLDKQAKDSKQKEESQLIFNNVLMNLITINMTLTQKPLYIEIRVH